MLKQYVPRRDDSAPLHRPGEVVIVGLGNYLEAGRRCSRKDRPAIILGVCDGQHFIAGLTTRPHCLTTGAPRHELPDPGIIGLNPARPSYLWSSRPSRICRLDVRRHVGWIDLETVEFLSRRMHLSPRVYTDLLRAAVIARQSPRSPR
jgi:hypothetical protein